MLEDGVNSDRQARNPGNTFSGINFKEAFLLATVAGAVILNIPVGKFNKAINLMHN